MYQGGQYRSYKYDAMGRLLYERIPEQTATINDGTGTVWSCAYSYTEFSSVKKKTDARGVETHYAFDALHRVTQTWYTGVGGDDSGSWRPGLPNPVAATSDVVIGYASWGAVSNVSIGNEYTETNSFDSYNRLISVTRWILGQTYDIRKTYTTSYEYNGGSQLSKVIYPSGQQMSVNHDDKGREQSLTYNPGDTFGYLTGMSYALTGQVTGLTLGNGVAETFAYDANTQQLATHTATKGATSLMNLSFSFNAAAGQMGSGSTAGDAGQLTTVSGTINSTTESASYTYDLLGRLVTSNQTSNGSSAQRKFAYDRWGNRTAMWPSLFGGSPIQSVTLEQSGGAPTNRITSVTNNGTPSNYLYDGAGNLTNDGVHSYTYDGENRLVKVDNGATATYNYDGQNRRVTKIIGSAWTHYIWEGTHVIAEHDATTAYSTNPTYQAASARADYVFSGARMIWNRQRPSSTGSWTASYYLSDRLSLRVVLDSTGNVTGRQAHLPFGEDFAETGTQDKHHFSTYERDSEAGVDYAVNRQESPVVGRFMRVDPLSSSAKKDSPQSWNRYAYSTNDPVNRTDPSGLDFFDPGGPPPCGDEQQTQFVVDGYQEVNWCAAMSFAWVFGPEPKPERTCTVRVNVKRIKGLPGVIFYHTFLTATDSETGIVTYAGARSDSVKLGGIGGHLVGTFGLFTTDVTPDASATVVAVFSKIFLSSCDAINRSFEASTKRINAEHFAYDPTDIIGHNSNAFSYSLLADYSLLSFFWVIADVSLWRSAVSFVQFDVDPLPGWLDYINS